MSCAFIAPPGWGFETALRRQGPRHFIGDRESRIGIGRQGYRRNADGCALLLLATGCCYYRSEPSRSGYQPSASSHQLKRRRSIPDSRFRIPDLRFPTLSHPHHSGVRDLTGATKKDILTLARENNVRFLRLQFTDILGVNKNVELPA